MTNRSNIQYFDPRIKYRRRPTGQVLSPLLTNIDSHFQKIDRSTPFLKKNRPLHRASRSIPFLKKNRPATARGPRLVARDPPSPIASPLAVAGCFLVPTDPEQGSPRRCLLGIGDLAPESEIWRRNRRFGAGIGGDNFMF